MAQRIPRRRLLVDGYNVIHAVESLRRLMRRNVATARDTLRDRLRILADFEEVTVILVFDGPGEQVSTQKEPGPGRLEVLYAPSHLTADGLIEHLVSTDDFPEELTVATHDHLIGEAARAAGAFVIGAEELMDWTERAEAHLRRTARRLREASAQGGGSPFDALDSGKRIFSPFRQAQGPQGQRRKGTKKD